MVSTNQKLDKKSCMKLLACTVMMSLFAFFGIIVTEDYPMANFYVVIMLEIITWMGSLIVIIREKDERSLTIVTSVLRADLILDFYLWWLIIVDGTVIEYMIMIVGILLGTIWGYTYKDNNKQEDEKKDVSILFVSILGMWIARLIGAFMGRGQIKIFIEILFDIVMMLIAFSIGMLNKGMRNKNITRKARK